MRFEIMNEYKDDKDKTVSSPSITDKTKMKKKTKIIMTHALHDFPAKTDPLLSCPPPPPLSQYNQAILLFIIILSATDANTNSFFSFSDPVESNQVLFYISLTIQMTSYFHCIFTIQNLGFFVAYFGL